jgi:hypothetical protein
MEKLGLILAIITLPQSLFFTFVKLNGSIFLKFLFRLLGFGGAGCSIIYILKYFVII